VSDTRGYRGYAFWMNIQQDSVVSIRYTLKDAAGAVLDSSGDDALSYLHGHGNLIPGLERELTGKGVGDRLNVAIAPADGYGERDGSLVQQVARSELSGIDDLQPGMRLRAESNSGVHAVTVTHVADDTVTLDANHPLAGMTLHFDVEVTAVREASAEELSHGHVHGPDDHHHH
jgi:FKBP-type peptidyl-prolyl cis-trans isomerase SlyD